MSEYAFFIEGKIEGGNKRDRHHWRARYGIEKRAREVWALQFKAVVPRGILVDSPHRLRTVTLTVYRKRLMDIDNLVAGLKPFIDILKCRYFKGKTSDPNMLTWRGIIYDDSPKYVEWRFKQEIVKKGDGSWGVEGVEVKVEGI